MKKKVMPQVRIAQSNIEIKIDNQTVDKMVQPERPGGKGKVVQPTAQR